MTKVVIVGGGFGGLRLARKLRNKKDISVTLINESPDFRYCPAIYRAATGYKLGLASLSLEWALLDITNVNLVIGRAVKFNAENKLVTIDDGTDITYDYVVFALGSVTTFFNIDGIHEHAFGIRTVEEIKALRNHIHNELIKNEDYEKNVVIVGAGPTGVEIAAGLGAYLKHISKEHKKQDHHISVWLVEAGPRIMPQMPKRASRAIARQLEKSRVKILTDSKVEGETIHNLKTSSGTIKTHTVIWSAGAINNPFFNENLSEFKINERGKVVVNKHLESSSHVYVIGDNAATPHSGLALTAISHANFVAHDILARAHGHEHRPTKFEHSPIQIVPVGKRWAIMKYGPILLHGRLIALIRRVADYIGYSEVLGYTKGLTIWTNSDNEEDDCAICMPGK